MKKFFSLLLLPFLSGCGVFFFLQYNPPFPPPKPYKTDRAWRDTLPERLKTHVRILAKEGERNFHTDPGLSLSKKYLLKELKEMGYEPKTQDYEESRQTFSNMEVELPGVGPLSREIVIVGAHYDTVEESPGADDNASGTAAVLELARLFKGKSFNRTLRFVAFANEEPPFFQDEGMGSYLYAEQSKKRGEQVTAMLSLESTGYYSEERGSQKYPPVVKALYPDKGNFIAFVGNIKSRGLVSRTIGVFRKYSAFPSEGIASPEFVPGIGWSDHWSFWRQGYPAVMITDTAPFRNPHYHEETDTPDTLDYPKMAKVVEGLVPVIADLCEN